MGVKNSIFKSKAENKYSFQGQRVNFQGSKIASDSDSPAVVDTKIRINYPRFILVGVGGLKKSHKLASTPDIDVRVLWKNRESSSYPKTELYPNLYAWFSLDKRAST